MADEAKKKPKKKPFMTIGVPGARRTLGGGTTGGGSPIFQPNLMGQMRSGKPPAMKGPTVREPAQTGTPPAGRPPSNLGKYLIKPTDTTVTGFEMLNDAPDVLDSVHTKFLEKFELPTHLRPTRFLSPELEHGRGVAISKGFRAQRSRSKG